MIFGLAAALGWGTSEVGAVLVGRRIGSFVTTLLTQAASLLAVAALVVVFRPVWRGDGSDVALLVLNGLLIAGAYALNYHALTLGPVALVSPVVGSYAVIPIVLGVAVLGERLAGLALAGVVVTVIGVILASTDLRRTDGLVGSGERPGLPFAFGAMAMFGAATFILGWTSPRVGWLAAAGIGRVVSVVVLGAAALARRPALRGRAGVVVGGAAVGILDVLGLMLFAAGTERGDLAIVSAASSTFAVIPVVAGIVLFGERPIVSQLVGVGLVIVGLVLLGLGG